MTMNRFKIYLLASFTFLLFSMFTCHDYYPIDRDETHHAIIRIDNQTGKSVYAGFSQYSPDSIMEYEEDLRYHYLNGVAPWSTSAGAVAYGYWEDYLTKHDSVWVYVLDAFLYDRHGMKNPSAILQSYRVSLSELNAFGWTLAFPPVEVMKDMTMRPTYNEVQELLNTQQETK